jgi:cold shock protein
MMLLPRPGLWELRTETVTPGMRLPMAWPFTEVMLPLATAATGGPVRRWIPDRRMGAARPWLVLRPAGRATLRVPTVAYSAGRHAPRARVRSGRTRPVARRGLSQRRAAGTARFTRPRVFRARLAPAIWQARARTHQDWAASTTKKVKMAQGTVKWSNGDKGYGVIAVDGGQDMFVHFSAIAGGGYRQPGGRAEGRIRHHPGPEGTPSGNVKVIG